MKGILLMNISKDSIGGASKRYINLFNYISQSRDDYSLIVNDDLYYISLEKKILRTNKNVFIIYLSKKKSSTFQNKAETKNSQGINNDSTKSALKVFLGRNRSLVRYFTKWLSFAFQLHKIIKQNKIHLIYGIWLGGIWAWPLRKMFGFKLIFSLNSYSIDDNSNKYFDFFSSRFWVLKNCDKIDFLSPLIVEEYKKKFRELKSNRICITPNSFINYEHYYPEYPKNKSIVFIGRLQEHKHPILFLQAIKKINENNQPLANEIVFYLIGEGIQELELRKYVFENNLFNLVFVGAISEPWKYLRKSMIFVSIQDNNYPSQALIEAMACGNAIIASDLGETRKIVTAEEGILVPLDAERISSAMIDLLLDSDKCDCLGKNARKKVLNEHTIENFARYFIEITS